MDSKFMKNNIFIRGGVKQYIEYIADSLMILGGFGDGVRCFKRERIL